ncbi:unnamed protein product, partial [Onchocerca flexuosa]|uniref:Uncharacterized protein n=1 Tax=Onchocerca flexuosa TaxID=387005 RepID=A0A183I6X8_9BILA
MVSIQFVEQPNLEKPNNENVRNVKSQKKRIWWTYSADLFRHLKKLFNEYSRNVWIMLLCLSQIAAVSLFISGFFPTKIRLLSDFKNNEQDRNDFLEGCPHNSTVKETLQKQMVTKLVIIVIDAWQEQFFNRRNTMQFLRQLTSNGQAVAFIAHTQTPTVTMPRIK